MFTEIKIYSRTVALSLIFISGCVFGESLFAFKTIEDAEKKEIWLNAGMYSYHYDAKQNLNSNNVGFGAEYKFSSVASVTVGGFKNSDSAHSNYAGIYWEPISVGPINLGLVAGGFNGYSSANNGGWFPAAFPAATIEGEYLGANLFFIPSVGDRVHGAISLQLKLKVLDWGG